MADFRRDFRAAPVPIRLNCPFSNGITLSYYARAVSCTSRVLRVISVNPFERELQLFVSAPFIGGLTRCQVASVTRSKRQASTFEIDLRFVDSPVLLGSAEDHAASLAIPRPSANPILNADIAFAASELAVALESSVGIPFAKAFGQVRNQQSHLKLLALIAAVTTLADQKGLIDADVAHLATRGKPSGKSRIRLVDPSPEYVSNRRAG